MSNTYSEEAYRKYPHHQEQNISLGRKVVHPICNALMIIALGIWCIDRFYDEKGFVYEREGWQWYKYGNFHEYALIKDKETK